MNVALLPLKANSERVIGKNFKCFAGKPLFRWILDKLLACDIIDQVVINTDAEDQLIKSGLELSAKILVRHRKPELCGDYVSMNSIIADDLANVEADTYLMTHTTNPLLSINTIMKAIIAYQNGLELGHSDSLFSVNRVQTRFYKADGSPVNHDPSNLIRTQDLEPWFEENSNLYIFSKSSFLATNARIGSRPLLFETPRCESIDIDDQDSWDIAEAIALSHTHAA